MVIGILKHEMALINKLVFVLATEDSKARAKLCLSNESDLPAARPQTSTKVARFAIFVKSC